MGWSIAILAVTVLNVGMILWAVLAALRIKNGPVGAVLGRVGPITTKGKAIADTGKREVEQNKTRLLALIAEAKGIAASVRPHTPGPGARINYRSVMTTFSVLRTVWSGLSRVRRGSKPTAHPPGPPKRRQTHWIYRLGVLPDAIRLFREVRRALRR